MNGGMSCQIKCSFLCGMVHVNSQSNITVHEKENDLMCETYLGLAGSLFSFFLYHWSFHNYGPFIILFRGNTVAFFHSSSLWLICCSLCSVSRAGWLIFSTQPEEKMSVDFLNKILMATWSLRN